MTSQLTRETMIGPCPLPPVDDDLRAEARRNPGQWITFLDPAIDPSVSNPPRFAVQGGYHADKDGNLDDSRINPSYEPSQTRAGFGFNNGLELTLWRLLFGFIPLGAFVDSLYHATVLTYAQSAEDTSLPLIQDPHNSAFSTFMVATSDQWCHWEHTNRVKGHMIFHLMRDQTDVLLDINSGTRFGLRMRVADLASLISDDTPHLVEQARAQNQQS